MKPREAIRLRARARRTFRAAAKLLDAAPTLPAISVLSRAAHAYRATHEPVDADAGAMVDRAVTELELLQRMREGGSQW